MTNIKIQKKDLWLLSAIVVFLIAVGYVIATGSTPQINGHSYSEIQTCSTPGQILKINATGQWECSADAIGGGSGGTPSNCAWVDVTWNTNNYCPAGKVVQGIDTCPRDGNRDVCRLYCCNIV